MYEKVVTSSELRIRFVWDERKANINFAKHHIDFETALRVFADPLAHAQVERIEDGEARWQTIGLVDGRLLLLVIHTSRTVEEHELTEVVRIISARTPTRRERRLYERETD